MAGRLGKVAKLEQEAAALQQESNLQQRVEAFRRGEAERARQQSVSAAAFREEHGLKTAEDCVALARTTLRSLTRVAADPAAHWRKVLANPKATVIMAEMARDAIRNIEARGVERDPGADDEEVHA